jgi:predicted PurR-regulated permease PerM
VLVGVLAAFLVTQGTPLVDRALRSIRRASIREEVHRAMGSARRRGGAHVRRTVAVSVVHGAVAGVVAGALGMPGAISLAAWVALAVTVPILGGPLAWAPVVAVAWAADVEPVAVTALAVLCIVADRAARARWVRTTVDIGPLLTLIGFGVGFYALGLPGAFVGLIAVAAIGAALDPGVTDVREVVEGLVDQPDAVTPVDGTPSPTGPAIVERTPAGPVLRLRLSRRTAIAAGVAVVAAIAALRLLDQVQGFVVWLVVGSFIAIGLDRPVAAMHRAWKVPRAGAVALVFAVVIGVVVAVGVVAGPSITDSADEIVADAPDAVESLESLPVVGAWLEENEVSERLGDEIAALPDRVRESHVVERVVDAAGDGFVGFLWVLAVILAVLLDGPRLVDVARRRVPVSSRREAVRFGRAAYDALSNLAAASAFVAVANGTVVMLIAVALGVPLAPVLGLWAAWWNVIPQVGGFVGAAPLVALAVGEGPWHGVIALVTFVTYQTIENHVIQPALGGRAVRLPPLVILVGVLIGASLFGFVGAILAGPALGLAKVAFDEVRGAPEPRIEDRGDAPA